MKSWIQVSEFIVAIYCCCLCTWHVRRTRLLLSMTFCISVMTCILAMSF